MPATRKILVTAALPYANNSLHLGHMVEYIQTDVWVRFQRMRGHTCYYACASDAHGTPTMLRAEEENTTPEALLARIYEEHKRDFATFRISVDNYLTTHAPENKELTELLYSRLVENGYIRRATIKQAYDDVRGMFLPDRYVRGTCPSCGASDQYGDSCEVCGATYTPLDMKDPISTVSGTKPSIKESEHLFLKLGDFEAELRQWVSMHVDPVMVRKLDEWFAAGLRDWDISRDAPYFGFEIPGERGKFFYVWFDALIGYMSSFLNLCRKASLDFDAYWGADSDAELYHFIGKDIVYFHTLYWPAMLGGAGFRRPSGVFAHGFLTVDGQKMSKRRGTFLMASRFAKHIDPDYLRYYFAAKLGSAPDDLDLSLPDFVAKVNADLVGKFVNIGSRCAPFIERLGDRRLARSLEDRTLLDEFARAGDAIAEDYEARNYARAMRRIMQLTDVANQYIDEQKPWVQAKDPAKKEAVIGVCTLGLNLFRTLTVYLKPVVPALAERIESFLGCGALQWGDVSVPLLDHTIGRFDTLLKRVEITQVQAVLAEHATATETTAAREAAVSSADEIDIALFSRLDLRIAKVTDARYVEGADKLLELKLSTGDGERTVFSGIRSAYEPAALVGCHVVLLANLRPRKMRFGVSEGMILAAGGDNGEIFLLRPDDGAKPGMRVS